MTKEEGITYLLDLLDKFNNYEIEQEDVQEGFWSIIRTIKR